MVVGCRALSFVGLCFRRIRIIIVLNEPAQQNREKDDVLITASLQEA